VPRVAGFLWDQANRALGSDENDRRAP